MVLALFLALLAPFRVDAGPYTGAYVVAPGGAVNWYFATTALLRLRHLPEPETRIYLDAYIAHLDPNEGIADVLTQANGIFAPIAPDSEDAYAATFLSLAARYRRESHDDAWWSRNASTLSAIAYAKLLLAVKPNGLIRASATDATGYLMDNVEDYDGLRSLAIALAETHAGDATYVASFVAPLGIAIHALYRPAIRAFLWSDRDPLGSLTPYPACTAQLFPQLHHVRGASNASDGAHFQGARETAARCNLSPISAPHEALLYAIYIGALPHATRRETRYAMAMRAQSFTHADLVTLSLRDALEASHPARKEPR